MTSTYAINFLKNVRTIIKVYISNANMKTKPIKNAFTLMELLVVISVIALLMGILLPVLNKVRAAGYRIACRSNLHSISCAFRMYLDTSDDVMPPASSMPSVELEDRPPITEFILPYLSEPKIFKCPSDRGSDSYFEKETTSYEYASMLGDQCVSQSFLTERLKLTESNIHIMFDYEPFHGKAGQPGAVNYLYADGHVGDLRGP